MARKDSDLARRARGYVDKWNGYWKANVDQYHELHNFVLGRQWTDDEEDMLKTYKKVPLQFNKLATLVNTLIGEQQQNTPQIETVPLSSCDEETISIRQVITKDIMLSTDSRKVYQVAFHQACVGGFGAYYLDTAYTHNKSFEQDIVYCTIKDATKAFWDIGAQDTNKIDGMYSGFISKITRQKFKELYGAKLTEELFKGSKVTQSKEEIALATQPDAAANPFVWSDEENVTIIDLYLRKYEKDTLYLLSNGMTVDQAEMDDIIKKSYDIYRANMMPMPGMMPGEGIENETEEEQIATDERLMLYYDGIPIRIIEKRNSKKSIIMHYKIAGEYVLDESEFPAEDLPVIFVDQNSYYDKDGKQVCRPFVIDAVDAQRYLNYLATQSAYVLKISRYDQWIGSKKNVQSLDTQQQWQDPSNVKGMMTYDESPSGAKPEQVRPPELSQSLVSQYQRAMEDLYTSTGLYPTKLGQEGNEVSGKAIDARTRQGSYTTYVAFNSINRAITAGGKILNQMIPRVYDTERVMTLMMPDSGRQNIVINQQEDEYGMRIKNSLTKGTFEVRLQAGPSYEGQKQQALESLNMVLAPNPQLFNLFADLYAENLPLINTLEIKNRLKTLVPPEIVEAGKTGQMPQQDQKQPSPEEQQAMADIKFKQEQMEIKKAQLELQIKEQEEKSARERAELEMKRLELMADLEGAKLRYMAETQRTQSDNAISHANNLTKLLTHKEISI